MDDRVIVAKVPSNQHDTSFAGILVEIHDHASESTLGIVLQSGFGKMEFFGLPKAMKEDYLVLGWSYRLILAPTTWKKEAHGRETWVVKRIEDVQRHIDLYDFGVFKDS